MNGLPKGWRAATLGDLAEYLNGAAFKPSDWGASGRPIIRIQNLTDPDKPLNRTAKQVPDKLLVKNGDILVSWSATLDAFIWNRGEAWLNQHIFRVLPNPTVVKKSFLFFLLKHEIAQLIETEHLHGSTMKHINRGPFLSHKIGLPPLPEQHCIIAKLDSLTGSTARAREELERIPRLIAKYREAILAAAFRGELTSCLCAERQGHHRDELPVGWTWERLENLVADLPRSIQSGPFGSNLLHSEFQSEGRLAIGIDNVQDGCFSVGSENRISESKFRELERYRARPFDVLITVMATVGRTCVVPADIEPSIITKHVYRISVDRERVDPLYLMNALRGSEALLEQMGANIRGQTRPGINGTILKELRVPLAPISEQREIVRRIETAFAWLDRVTAEHTNASRLLPKLEQAILAKAFKGELTASFRTATTQNMEC